MITNFIGLGRFFLFLIFKRLELNFSISILLTYIKKFRFNYKKEIIGFFNNLLSQINSVNNAYLDLKKLNILRFYLIKSSRGWSHALGKPVRGQRTWSNAWTTYNYNRILRKFIYTMRLDLLKNKKEQKINYKLIQKKYATKKKKITGVSTKAKKYIWF